MRKQFLMLVLAITTLSIRNAEAAGQWTDVFGAINTTPGFLTSAQNPSGLQATSVYVSGDAAVCPAGFIPVADGGPDGSRLQPVSSPPGVCSMVQSALINLSQLASESDLLALQAQVAGANPIEVNAALASFQTQIDIFTAEMSQLDQRLRMETIRSNQGVAMSMAMAGTADLQTDEHFAISANWGTYQGQNGAAVGVAYRVADHISINGGFAGSLNGGPIGGRAGIRFGW